MNKEKILRHLNLIKETDINTLKGFDMPHEELEEEIEALIEAIELIEQKPIIGHWVKTPKAVMGEGYMWYCDNCEHQVYQDSSRNYPSENYCPNCGAKMVANVDCISRQAVEEFVEYIQTIKDKHNEDGSPINYGTICDLVIRGYELVERE